MKRAILLSLSLVFASKGFSFCGFYVAKADSKLFNKSSQVIMVRNGDKTTITMANDFQGDVKDFAMVVPVPVVLEKKDIKTMDASLFTKLDQYSAPRIAKYIDRNPCYVRPIRLRLFRRRIAYHCARFSGGGGGGKMKMKSGHHQRERTREEVLGINIKAKYNVGEYDIMILSAKNSNGLETYLTEKGYKIPKKAQEVLHPYIKSGMQFFVVKVNLEKAAANGKKDLTPIQISFKSEKFMLPIRLGMANADGDQDMLVYCITKEGRVETTNYRTVKIPTNKNIPLPVKNNFGNFYKAVFNKTHKDNGQSSVLLEYAWDMSQKAPVKCDPCVGPPPMVVDAQKMGVDWLDNNGYGPMFFTRLHVRYNRKTFPQDLSFQVTKDKSHFQGRYVIHIPHTNTGCSNGNEYIRTLKKRRITEVGNLMTMTGWGNSYEGYINEFHATPIPKRTTRKGTTFGVVGVPDNGDSNSNFPYLEVNYLRLLLYFIIGSVIFFSVAQPRWVPVYNDR